MPANGRRDLIQCLKVNTSTVMCVSRMLVFCDVTQHCTDRQWEAPKSTIFVVTMLQNCTYLCTAVVQLNNNNNNSSSSSLSRWQQSAAQQESGRGSIICSVSLGFLGAFWKLQEPLWFLATYSVTFHHSQRCLTVEASSFSGSHTFWTYFLTLPRILVFK